MRFATSFLLLLLVSASVDAFAGSKRRGMTPPSSDPGADALAIGPISGSAVSGVVASVSGTAITLNSGAAPSIVIDASGARFATQRRTSGSIDDVHPGARITAFIETGNNRQAGGPLRAQWIVVESDADLTVAGAIESIDLVSSTLTVLGIEIAVDASTTYSTAFPTFAPIRGLTDLARGEVVVVSGRFAGEGIVATSVHVLAPESRRPAILSGTVKSIAEDAWTITTRDDAAVVVAVDSQTRILGDPKVGDTVQIMASVDAAGAYRAIAIVKLPAGGMQIELPGIVKSIAPTQWVLGGPLGSMAPDIAVRITPETKIYPDPKVGDHVLVRGSRGSDGIFTASRITKLR